MKTGNVTMVTKEQILHNRKAVFLLVVAGIRQKHEFFVEHMETAVGKIPFLVSRRALPVSELSRVAEESQLPVFCAGQKIFPKGKSPKDFLNL